MESAFQTKQVQGKFAILRIDSEDKRATALPGRVRHSEKGVDEDLMMDDRVTHTLSPESAAGHEKLQRRHSDGVQWHARQNSLLLPSTTKLPKIPARRLSSDVTMSGRQFVYCEDGLSRIPKTCQNDRNQGFPGSDLTNPSFPVNRKSLPQQRARRAQGHHLVARRQSAPCHSASRQRNSSVTTCNENSSWQIKKHKRTLNIEDDDSDNLEESWSRKSSSSSGFSSLSSLI